jgi:solute carrier family 25 (adenine nucleotide translocator) protein 4/5/6/31
MTDCIIKIKQSDGVRGIYKGFGLSVATIIVYREVYFGFFESGRVLLFPD